MINMPLTAFNIILGDVSYKFSYYLQFRLWPDQSPVVLIIGIILQATCTVFLLTAGMTDPGIIPSTYVSPLAKKNIGRKYTNVRNKD